MGSMTINGRRVEFTDEKSVLSVIRKAGINLPTLCYLSHVSTFGACRLCMVEDQRGKTFASCSEVPRDGMVIYTNTVRLQKYRKMIVQLLLGSHDRDCTTCEQSGDCKLQSLAYQMHVQDVPYKDTREIMPLDLSSPSIVRNPNKCILCGDCVRACSELQGLGVLGFTRRGSSAQIAPAFDRPLAETDCVNCGQCRVACPTGAITIRTNVTEVMNAIDDPNTRVVCHIAPAVRVAIGDAFRMESGSAVMGRIVNALHTMGFDEVYDMTLSADLTIMEEAEEFVQRFTNGEKLPLMTSCCPAWVKFCEEQYPMLKENISTCRSPQGMMGAILKEYYRDPKNAKGKKTMIVSIIPCTAKKMELGWKKNYTKGEKDTDIAITSQELIRMIKNFGIDFENLEPEACDMPFGFGSGGGVIFGNSGGVAEAVIRRLAPDHRKETLDQIAASGVRKEEWIKEFKIPYAETEVKVCVISGLSNARIVLDKMLAGEVSYDLIEVMACRGGCIMGGGQPVTFGKSPRAARRKGLYEIDSVTSVRKCDENPFVLNLYNGMLKGNEHELLHVHTEE